MKTLEERKARLQLGINYLRTHAIEAHLKGDGFRVTHLCSLALSKVIDYGKANANDKFELRDVRWACFLGMYWIVHDWFLNLVRDCLDHVITTDVNSTDNELVVLIHNQLQNPHQRLFVDSVEVIPGDWWESRGAPDKSLAEEDVIALTFLFELVWYSNPSGGEWKELFRKWVKIATPDNRLILVVSRLLDRLEFQSRMYDGGAFSEAIDSSSLGENDVQKLILNGWQALYLHEHEVFERIHRELKHKIDVEHPSYIAFWSLQHRATLHRRRVESQYISLPKFHMARTRRSAELFNFIRHSHGDAEYRAIAEAGFPTNSHASSRYACLRMAMLVSLQSLRTWDVGGWLSGVRMRSKINLEIAVVSGDQRLLVEGLLDSVRGQSLPDTKKEPRFTLCIRMLDGLSVEYRSELTRSLLKSPPIEWRQTQSLLKLLSDSIPAEVHLEMADWSLKVESTDLLNNLWTDTLLDIWERVLFLSPYRSEITVRLKPVLVGFVSKPMHWHQFHNTIIEVILASPVELGNELLGILLETKCDQAYFSGYRFSICFNLTKHRFENDDRLLKFLKNDATNRQNRLQMQLVKQLELSLEGHNPKKDNEFRRWLVKAFHDRLTDRAELTGPSIPIGGSEFGELSRLVDWPSPTPKLVQRIFEAIDSEKVLFSDKFDYIVFLGELVKAGPRKQAREVALKALTWLHKGIIGRDLGLNTGGPLSQSQIHLKGEDELHGALLYLIRQCSSRCPEVVQSELFRWLPLNAPLFLPKFASHILEIFLLIMAEVGKNNSQSVAILVGLADGIVMLAIEQEPVQVILAFRQIVLEERISTFETACSRRQKWAEVFFNQWAQLACSPKTDP